MNISLAFWTLMGLFVLWFFLFYLWPDLRNDTFREDIFAARDAMFMYAAEGQIAFDHPSYLMMRDRMNVLLRFGHEFSLTKVLLIYFIAARYKSQPTLEFERAISSLPEHVQHKMQEFNLQVLISTLQHVVYYSFIRYVMLRPLMFVFNPFDLKKIMDKPNVVSTVERVESITLERVRNHPKQHHVAAAH